MNVLSKEWNGCRYYTENVSCRNEPRPLGRLEENSKERRREGLDELTTIRNQRSY
jgi:hypothetical protein